MWSSRNGATFGESADDILDHWDMWSSRNKLRDLAARGLILDHWDMWSSRNPSVASTCAAEF